MTYKTVEAYLENNVISLPKSFSTHKKKVKVLVVFQEEEKQELNLTQIPEEEITDEMRELSRKALKKDKKLLSNI